jgi:hypothetical protein
LRACAKATVDDVCDIRLFMPLPSSSADRLPSPLLSMDVKTLAVSPTLAPVFWLILSSKVPSSAWSTLPLPSASTLANILAWWLLRWVVEAAQALPEPLTPLMVLIVFPFVFRLLDVPPTDHGRAVTFALLV